MEKKLELPDCLILVSIHRISCWFLTFCNSCLHWSPWTHLHLSPLLMTSPCQRSWPEFQPVCLPNNWWLATMLSSWSSGRPIASTSSSTQPLGLAHSATMDDYMSSAVTVSPIQGPTIWHTQIDSFQNTSNWDISQTGPVTAHLVWWPFLATVPSSKMVLGRMHTYREPSEQSLQLWFHAQGFGTTGSWKAVKASKIAAVYMGLHEVITIRPTGTTICLLLDNAVLQCNHWLAKQQSRLGAGAHAICLALTKANEAADRLATTGACPQGHRQTCSAEMLLPSAMCYASWQRNAQQSAKTGTSCASIHWVMHRTRQRGTNSPLPKRGVAFFFLLLMGGGGRGFCFLFLIFISECYQVLFMLS